MKTWQAVAATAGAYVLFLLMTAPAAKVLPWLQPQDADVGLAGISGSIWSGKALQVRGAGLSLTDVVWDVRLFALFKGALELDVDGRLNGQPVNLRAGRGLFSGRYLRDVQGRVSAAELLRRLKVTTVSVDGELELALDSVSWAATEIPLITGTITWMPALLSRPVELNLGSAQLDVAGESAATQGRLTASGGALTVDAEVSLQTDGRYALNAVLKKQGAVPAEVDNFLNTFTEIKDGNYRLEWSDQLKF